jgi:hypothetical protein
VAVFDSRKRKIRGVWRRGTRYYAQMWMDRYNQQFSIFHLDFVRICHLDQRRNPLPVALALASQIKRRPPPTLAHQCGNFQISSE